MAENWQHWEGRSVDGFVLRRFLGGSDSSAVFLTERGNSQAAIKLLPVANDPDIQISQWNAAARLGHPALISLFETGRCALDGTEFLYCVMEYAEENLAQILPQRRLTPEEASQLLTTLLGVLAFLHDKNCVHGHLKPSNVFAVGDQIKLASDGISAAGVPVEPSEDVYQAPEITGGKAISAAADVWAVGVLLIQGLTQQNPRKQFDKIVWPTEALPVPFQEIAEHCLRPEPKDRWTVAQIAEKLRDPHQPSPVIQEARVRKKPILWGATAVIVLVFCAMLFFPHKRQPQGSSNVATGAATTQSSGTQGNPESATPASSTTPGSLAEGPIPNVPRSAANTIQGRVKVKLRLAVDPRGNVIGSRFESRGPSPYFANLALKTANRWKFVPPQVDGKGISSVWDVRFEFGRGSTNAFPTQVRP